ncbi:mitochondrial potassium channel ATP-binding subunit isoform X1 [Harmonia axyridis]|uniref:mitochondrial potassium channel ATP-binding subunit isoform X1 n=2 Tax=Harmonia axyridis TaxID=115357 RepID=UPI001E2770C3|nr:mitochondrial potassium channel ATP-binding subunit isoform X1 [Harmonia axyridis]
MSRLFLNSFDIRNFFRSKTIVLRSYSKFYSKVHNAPQEKIPNLLQKSSKIGVFAGGGTVAAIILRNHRVFCEKKTRLSGYKDISTKNVPFNWKKLWKYLKPHVFYFFAAIAGALIVAILNIQIPLIIGNIINIVSRFGETNNSKLFIEQMTIPCIKIIAMYGMQAFSTFFYIHMLSHLGEKMAFSMKRDLFEAVLKQDIGFFDDHRTGEVINRLTSDIQDFKSSFKQTVSGGLRAITQIIGCSASLVMISPQMTLITLLCVPSIVVVGTIFGKLLRNISIRAQVQGEKSTSVADEAVANIRTVRAFAMEADEEKLFETEAALAMDLNIRLGFGIGLFQAGTNLFLNGMVLGTIYMGGYLLATKQLSSGELMAFLIASQTIQRSFAQISLLFGSVIRGMASGTRVFEYMDMKPMIPLTGGHIIPDDKLKGNIEFRNVEFSYPSRPDQVILKDFNLSIPAGKTVAIVGASGNGKSTVVALLERFYDVNAGSITLDGEELLSLDPSWLRKRALGLISQEPILFGTSIIENIRYGKPDATDEEVINAAHLANAHNFITSFPQGYETLVGERGATLSGGQKQRIAIARALLKNPTVLLLDEATSALDTESEKIVQAALEKAQKGRTVIVIAHRLSTIENADIIVVLHRGKIVEVGNHEFLKNSKGYYWSLIYQQQEVPAG